MKRKIPELGNVILEMNAAINAQSIGVGCGTPLPWHYLEKGTHMLRPGTLSIVGGPTKTGKSFFLQAIALHLQEQGISWAYLPLEDGRKEFITRCLAIRENNYNLLSTSQETADYRSMVLKTSTDWIKEVMANVSENPRIGCKNGKGETVIPAVGWKQVVGWVRNASNRKVIFIDPLSQIEFNFKNQNAEEADFIRQLLGMAQDSQSCIVLAAHTVKRRGKETELPLTEGDLQGSAMLSRLAHTLILLEAHDERLGSMWGKDDDFYNRTVYIPSARNGSGTRQKIAFSQCPEGPLFIEKGILMPKVKICR